MKTIIENTSHMYGVKDVSDFMAKLKTLTQGGVTAGLLHPEADSCQWNLRFYGVPESEREDI